MKQNLVYKTTNLLNNKIYIGIHFQTIDHSKFDGYLGSGDLLKKAIQKYGKENFVRETLYSYLSREEASKIELELVDKNFVARDDTYNLAEGGVNQFLPDSRNNPMKNKATAKKASETYRSNFLQKHGVSHHMKLPIMQDKMKQTLLYRYGVSNPMKVESIKLKQKNTFLKNTGKKPSYIQIFFIRNLKKLL
jgi:hypothetical protein